MTLSQTSAPNHRVVLALAAAALLVSLSVATAAAQNGQPSIRISEGTVAQNSTTSIDVVLTRAPDGLAGYYLELSVEDSGVARIETASYSGGFGMTTQPSIEGGRTVTLEAADLDGRIQPGATDVTLATVNVSGVSSGEARFTLDPVQFDSDAGGEFEPDTETGVVTVRAADSAGESAVSDGPDGSGDTGAVPTPVVVLAVGAVLLAAGVVIGRRL